MKTIPSSANTTEVEPITVNELVERSYKNSVLETKIWREMLRAFLHEVTKSLAVGETVRIEGLGLLFSYMELNGDISIGFRPSQRLKTTLNILKGEKDLDRFSKKPKSFYYSIKKYEAVQNVVESSKKAFS